MTPTNEVAVGPQRGLLDRLPGPTLLRHLLPAVIAGVLLWLLTRSVTSFTDSEIASVGYYLPAVAGLTVLTGLNGQISLGHGALMMVGAYTTAKLLEHGSGVGFTTLTVLVSVAVTALVGILVGAAAARLRGPYLAGATLTLAVGLPALTNKYAGFLGGDNGLIVNTPVPPASLGTLDPLRYTAWITLLAALITFVLLANLIRSKVGRDFRAVRDDEVAAALSGLSVARTQVLAFVVSSACAGVAGSMLALTVGLAAPGAFTLLLSLSLIIAIVFGGLGSLAGAVWGSLALVYVPKYALRLATNGLHVEAARGSYLAYAIYGFVLVLVALTAPRGVQGLLRSLGGLVRRGMPTSFARKVTTAEQGGPGGAGSAGRP